MTESKLSFSIMTLSSTYLRTSSSSTCQGARCLQSLNGLYRHRVGNWSPVAGRVLPLPLLYSLTSCGWDSKSLIAKLNNKTPSREPWGTPPRTHLGSERVLPILTSIVRSVRNEATILMSFSKLQSTRQNQGD